MPSLFSQKGMRLQQSPGVPGSIPTEGNFSALINFKSVKLSDGILGLKCAIRSYCEQECIPVGCVQSYAVAVSRGCLPREMSA